MNNEEFSRYWSELRWGAPSIALFEDFDAVFNGRTNVPGESGGGLTFDCLLNALSGTNDVQGVVLMVTTNALETIDSALMRPGRLDRVIEIEGLTPDEVSRLASVILDDPEDRAAVAARFLAERPPGAVAKEYCLQRALARLADKET